MPSLPTAIMLLLASLPGLIAIAFMVHVFVRYSAIVARIFEERPLFLPLRVSRTDDGEDVQFLNRSGLKLAGTYLKGRATRRTGIIIFAHEFLGNRWSVLPYLDHLRDRGFDLFTFDFRNHGDSQSDTRYEPLQWVTNHEVEDLKAAIHYLDNRPDTDPAGYGLFGVSRGGGTALCVAAQDHKVWGIITDGAFPTRGTMVSYIRRWARIYVQSQWFWKIAPTILFEYLAWTGRVRTEFRLKCRYFNIERAVPRIAPRPWLAIHGQKDAYINVGIVEGLFALAQQPKEIWIVPAAKHNRCREKDAAAYSARLVDFYEKYAPRRLADVGQPLLPSLVEPIPILADQALAIDPFPLPSGLETTVPA